ncbi:hypothetical protein NQZ68_023169 [Dissostichus eleginoides]|nr:hypothetical protein NQZ68_023169 [Dissostichus eleginoides]
MSSCRGEQRRGAIGPSAEASRAPEVTPSRHRQRGQHLRVAISKVAKLGEGPHCLRCLLAIWPRSGCAERRRDQTPEGSFRRPPNAVIQDPLRGHESVKKMEGFGWQLPLIKAVFKG